MRLIKDQDLCSFFSSPQQNFKESKTGIVHCAAHQEHYFDLASPVDLSTFHNWRAELFLDREYCWWICRQMPAEDIPVFYSVPQIECRAVIKNSHRRGNQVPVVCPLSHAPKAALRNLYSFLIHLWLSLLTRISLETVVLVLCGNKLQYAQPVVVLDMTLKTQAWLVFLMLIFL